MIYVYLRFQDVQIYIFLWGFYQNIVSLYRNIQHLLYGKSERTA